MCTRRGVGYPLDNQRKFALGILCRELCRNWVIPARVGPDFSVSLAATQKADNAQLRTNTASACYSDFFGVALNWEGRRTFKAWVAGSNPAALTISIRSGPDTWVTQCTGHMGDTFGTERIFKWFEHSSVQVEVPQIIIHKTHQPDVVER